MNFANTIPRDKNFRRINLNEDDLDIDEILSDFLSDVADSIFMISFGIDSLGNLPKGSKYSKWYKLTINLYYKKGIRKVINIYICRSLNHITIWDYFQQKYEIFKKYFPNFNFNFNCAYIANNYIKTDGYVDAIMYDMQYIDRLIYNRDTIDIIFNVKNRVDKQPIASVIELDIDSYHEKEYEDPINKLRLRKEHDKSLCLLENLEMLKLKQKLEGSLDD